MYHTKSKPHVHTATPETSGHTLNRMAPFYDKFVQFLMLGKERKARLETIEQAQIKLGDQILDVGCGTGNLTIAAAQRLNGTGKVCGIDPAAKMIEIAQRKIAQKGLDIDFRVGLIENIPYPDNHFDVVFSSLMMHHLPLELKANSLFTKTSPGNQVLMPLPEPDAPYVSEASEVFPDFKLSNPSSWSVSKVPDNMSSPLLSR